MFEAAVTKKTSKGNTVKLVTIDPKDKNKETADAAASNKKGGASAGSGKRGSWDGYEEPDWIKNHLSKEEFIDMMFVFVEFRLEVSGGSEYGCMVSMNSVSNFLDEIFLYDNMR